MKKKAYNKPKLAKHAELKNITFSTDNDKNNPHSYKNRTDYGNTVLHG